MVAYMLEADVPVETVLAYYDEIERVAWLIADNPRIGRERIELHPDLRSFPVHSHIIFYRVSGHDVQVVRILHGRRDTTEKLFS